MTVDLAELNLKDDLERAVAAPDAVRWQLEQPGPLEISAAMHPASNPTEIFHASLIWASYPNQPPSLKFRDPATGRLDLPAAWPIVRGFRPTSLDACVNWCLEGLNLHPEWKTDPRFRWDPRGNPLLRILRTLQDELDEHFQGRYR